MRSVKSDTWLRNEIIIERSQFITTLAHTPTEDAARQLIAEVREEFPDATHNCSAFVVKPAGMNEIGHSNDDGEPSGTAGMPMLEVFLREGLVNVTAVVTRYFGGTLLGAGGLIRAYSSSVSQALKRAQIVQVKTLAQLEVELPHAIAGRVEAILRGRGFQIRHVDYSQAVTITCAVDEDERPALLNLLAELSAGQASWRDISPTTIEVDA